MLERILSAVQCANYVTFYSHCISAVRRRRSAWLGGVFFCWVLAGASVQATNFVVNSTGDQADLVLDNVCDVGGGICTLRAAIQEANRPMGATDTIQIIIAPAGAHTIVLTGSLPAITRKVTIDGTTQPGWVAAGSYPPVIEVNAAGAPGDTFVISSVALASDIRGLCINRSPGAAIRIQDSSSITIAGNFLGTTLAGTAPGPGNVVGINIAGNSVSNTIGGTTPADRNIIAHNTGDGVQLTSATSTGNSIQGNAIHSNGFGIDLDDDGVTANDAIPDADTGANNRQNYPVLTAAMTNGLGTSANVAGWLDSATSATYRIEFFANATADTNGNYEGQRYLGFTNVTTVAGTRTFGVTIAASLAAGEFVTATATNTTTNDTSEFSAAILAYSELVVTTTADTADGTTTNVSTLVGAPGRTAHLPPGGPSSHERDGRPEHHPLRHPPGRHQDDRHLRLRPAGDHEPLDHRRHHPAGLGECGALRTRRRSERRWVRRHSGSATRLLQQHDPRSLSLQRVCLPRRDQHIRIVEQRHRGELHRNEPGRDRSGAGQRQRHHARKLERYRWFPTTSDNRIGVNPLAVDVRDRNVISANIEDGIQFRGDLPGGVSGTIIAGNYIGTDVNGTADLGNGNQGIAMFHFDPSGSFTNTVIGGTAVDAGNLISGNGGWGVLIARGGTSGTIVQGNKIGTDAAGTAGIANNAGIRLDSGSVSGNTIGGIVMGAKNIIAYNSQQGIRFEDTAGNNNSILGTRSIRTAGLAST